MNEGSKEVSSPNLNIDATKTRPEEQAQVYLGQSAGSQQWISPPIGMPGFEQSYKTPESPEERQVRLNREQADAKLERWKDGARFAVGLAGSVVIAATCFYIVMTTGWPTGTQELAKTILVGVVGGYAGYVSGKNSK